MRYCASTEAAGERGARGQRATSGNNAPQTSAAHRVLYRQCHLLHRRYAHLPGHSVVCASDHRERDPDGYYGLLLDLTFGVLRLLWEYPGGPAWLQAYERAR